MGNWGDAASIRPVLVNQGGSTPEIPTGAEAGRPLPEILAGDAARPPSPSDWALQAAHWCIVPGCADKMA